MQTNKKPPLVPPDLSSTELQEWQRAAQASHERIVQSLDSVAKARQSVIQTCAKSIGVPQERDINRLIWHGVVRYANTATDAKGAAEAFLAFQGFCTLCLIRLRDPLDMIGIRDASFEDLESRAAAGTLTTFKGFFEACCHRLSTLHRPFEAMLTWLADPNGRSSAQKSQAIEFLVEHGGEGTIELDLSANDNFDDTGNEGAPFFYWKTTRSYRTILSPVARFILDRIEQYQADDNKVRLALADAIPLMICKRPACRRFAVLRRRTKDFCSASCRTLHRQETKPEEHAAYQRKYREIYKKPKQ